MITLDRLVNVLGGYGARLAHCPVPRSLELRSVALPETVGGRVVTGDVLLAVGAHTAEEAVRLARTAHAAVVLVRNGGPVTSDADAAVLTIDSELAWSEVAAVVYGLVLEGRETESGRGPTDLFAVADSLAGTVRADVMITDRHGELVAHSRHRRTIDPAGIETILARRHPDFVIEFLDAAGVFAHLERSGEALWVAPSAAHGLSGRMVVAVRAGRELLGSVWASTTEPMDRSATTALVEGAHTVALHLLRSRASADLERQVESDNVARLLDDSADAITLASRLGLPQDQLRVVAVHADLGGDRHAGLLLAFDRATAGFGWSRPGRSTLTENTVYTVLAADEADTARLWIDGLRAALPPALILHAGVSGASAVTDLRAARQEADECLALHEAGPAGDPPAYEEAWAQIVLRRLQAVGRHGRAPQRGPVARLREHDALHSTRYLETLRAWLAAQGDPAAAGVRLGVHENTVRYRLRKMAEITDLPVDDADKRLAMMIELSTDDSE